MGLHGLSMLFSGVSNPLYPYLGTRDRLLWQSQLCQGPVVCLPPCPSPAGPPDQVVADTGRGSQADTPMAATLAQIFNCLV